MRLLLLLVTCFSVSQFYATTFWVNNLQDAGIGSLREASLIASDGDTIRFNDSLILSGSDTLFISSGSIRLNGVVLKGIYNFTDTLYISAKYTAGLMNYGMPLLRFSGTKFVADSLVFIDKAGGLLGDADTTFILNSLFRNLPGKALHYNGVMKLSVKNCIIQGCYDSLVMDESGAINVTSIADSLIINNCIIDNNRTDNSAGAIYSKAKNLIIINSNIFNNKCYDSKAVVYTSGTNCESVTIANSIFKSNNGGILYSGVRKNLNINNSFFENNQGGIDIINPFYSWDTIDYSPKIKISTSQFTNYKFSDSYAHWYDECVLNFRFERSDSSELIVDSCFFDLYQEHLGYNGVIINVGNFSYLGNTKSNSKIIISNNVFEATRPKLLTSMFKLLNIDVNSLKLNFLNNYCDDRIIQTHVRSYILAKKIEIEYRNNISRSSKTTGLSFNFEIQDSIIGFFDKNKHTYSELSFTTDGYIDLDINRMEIDSCFDGITTQWSTTSAVDYNIKLRNSTIMNAENLGVRFYDSSEVINCTLLENNRLNFGYTKIKNSTIINKLGTVSFSGACELSNSILVRDRGYPGHMFTGNLVSKGYNVFSGNRFLSNSNPLDTFDVYLVDSLYFTPVQNNGGFTKTLMPRPPSLLINKGDTSDFSPAQNRPVIQRRDIGATEYNCQVTVKDTIYSCSPITWYNNLIHSSGEYQTILLDSTSSINCDTIIELNFLTDTLSTSNITVCDSIKWYGRTYFNSGVYTQGLHFGSSCGLFDTLNLNIVNQTRDTTFSSFCDEYQLPSGKIINSTGVYYDTIMNVLGCDSLMVLNLSKSNIDTNISVNGSVLTSNDSNSIYQWLDCDSSYLVINGAVNRFFSPLRNGNYAVAITKNLCTDTSGCYLVYNVGVEDYYENTDVSIYPNPFSNEIFLNVKGGLMASVFVYDMRGKIIDDIQVKSNSKSLKINFSKLHKGMFFIKIVDKKGNVFVHKIIKE